MTRVAVVTGAARGIGAATVIRLAADGWSVVAVDRCSDDPRVPYRLGTQAEMTAVVERARELGGSEDRVASVVGDAVSSEDMTRAVLLAERDFGGVDAIIAVAGVIAGGVPLWEMPVEQQDAVIEVNLKSVLVAACVGIPALLRRPQPRTGRFLAVASAAATRGLPMLAAYCASKAGVTGLVRALAAELRGTGVTANAVSPGSTATPILDESARLYGLESTEAFSSQQPIARLIRREEVAATIAWLADASTDAMTGATVPVDGGSPSDPAVGKPRPRPRQVAVRTPAARDSRPRPLAYREGDTRAWRARSEAREMSFRVGERVLITARAHKGDYRTPGKVGPSSVPMPRLKIRRRARTPPMDSRNSRCI